jgi:hypothetical protein
MNRQELFHGEPHLISVSRADWGYRGASIFHFPHFLCHFQQALVQVALFI